VSLLAALRMGRSLRRGGSSNGGRWELPLLAGIATFILVIGSSPFVAPASGWRFVQQARFDWVGPGVPTNEVVRSVPQVSLAPARADGDYHFTPDLVFVTLHVVRPEAWARYQQQYLGGNLDRAVSPDDLVIDEQSARALRVEVGDDVAVISFDAPSAVPVVTVRVGAIVPPYVEPGTSAIGLAAITGRRLGAAVVADLAPQGRPWRFGTGLPPSGASSRGSIGNQFLSSLVAAGTGPATTGTVLLGAFLWWIALARYARRLVERDRRAVALLVTLGSRARVAAGVGALPVLVLGCIGTVAGSVVASRLVFRVVEQRYVTVLAFIPLAGFMVAVSALAAYRTYRGLLAMNTGDRLAGSLTKES